MGFVRQNPMLAAEDAAKSEFVCLCILVCEYISTKEKKFFFLQPFPEVHRIKGCKANYNAIKEEAIMKEIKEELEELELGKVTGGTGSKSDCDYVIMSIQGNILKVYAGYDVRNINVCRNNSQIRYTRSMTSGQTLDIKLFGDAPMTFEVTGYAVKDNVNFKCSLP